MNARTRTVIALTAAALAAGSLTACASVSPSNADPAAEFEHTHGLGYHPGTGIVFAATHTGMWELPTSRLPSSFGSGSLISLPDDTPRLMGDRQQDIMGSFVTDSGVVLGSGHPDPTDTSAPANLGLITSDDAGRAWTAVSLEGEADFHDIAAITMPTGVLRIYGYDATRSTILVSDDGGMTWSGGALLELRDMTIDPTNPDRIYATTAAGLQVSDDVARTFTPVADAPALILIDATETGYVGIDTAGVIWSNDGIGWVQGSSVTGDPQALSFVGGSEPWVLISDARGVIATADFGASFIPLVEVP